MNNEVQGMLGDFLNEEAENQDEALTLLDMYVENQLALEDEIIELEMQIKTAKKNLAVYSEKKIPDILIKHNLLGSKIEHGGHKVKVEEVIRGSIKVDNRVEAHKWLEKRGFGDIIDVKIELKFKPDERDKANTAMGLLVDGGYEYSTKESVHSSRLNSFVKTQVTEGSEEFPKQLFGVYEGYKTKIER